MLSFLPVSKEGPRPQWFKRSSLKRPPFIARIRSTQRVYSSLHTVDAVLSFLSPHVPLSPHEDGFSTAISTPLSHFARACHGFHGHHRQIPSRSWPEGANFEWPTDRKQRTTLTSEWATGQQSNRRASRSIETPTARARSHLCDKLRSV